MRKKIVFSVFGIILSTAFLMQIAAAQGLTVQLVLSDASSMPLFVSGHEGEQDQISGFVSDSEILYEGLLVGTSTSTILFTDPPFDSTLVYNDLTVTSVFSFPGAGSLNFTGTGTVFTGSGFMTTANGVFAFVGQCAGGTDLLSGLNCVGSGLGMTNFITGLGTTSGTLYIE